MEEGPPAAKRQRMDLPPVGFGTYKLGAETEVCVLAALGCGYRLIDTAQIYGNEKAVGQAITKSGLPRQEIFITSKVWRTKHGYDRARASCLQTLKDLGLQYIDLMLVHWPRRGFEGRSFRASLPHLRRNLCQALTRTPLQAWTEDGVAPQARRNKPSRLDAVNARRYVASP